MVLTGVHLKGGAVDLCLGMGGTDIYRTKKLLRMKGYEGATWQTRGKPVVEKDVDERRRRETFCHHK